MHPNNCLILTPLPSLPHQSRTVLNTGDLEGARKYGRLSMVLSCVAMLVGVAVTIFLVFTLGMGENTHTCTKTRRTKAQV